MRRAPNADPEDASFPSAQSTRPVLAQLKPSCFIPRYLKSFRWIVITLTFILVSWIASTRLVSQPNLITTNSTDNISFLNHLTTFFPVIMAHQLSLSKISKLS
jgi:hypothetical protein